MDKKEIFKIIKENSYMKYCICNLIENIKDTREYRDLKKYLEQIVVPEKDIHSKIKYEKNRRTFERIKNEKNN